MKKHTRRNYKQTGWIRGLNQWVGGQGRKKHPDRARKGTEAQKEWIGAKGNARQHET